MKKTIQNIKKFYIEKNLNAWVIFFFLIYVVFVIKIITFRELNDNFLFGVYSIVVSLYILSRFALAHLYNPHHSAFDPSYEPTATFAVPSKNEGENIFETITKIAESDYPAHKFNIVAINDGSTDNTLSEMLRAKEFSLKKYNIEVIVVNWEINKGKREGMAECIRISKNDLVVFIDSDSFVKKNTLRELAKYFNDDSVAAVAGHAYVANENKNYLTKMQAVRYFVAFKAYKAAESLFGSVTCCSGCCSAYRRTYLNKILDRWLNQKFLGEKCTYGDDRSLTNFLLRTGYKALFSPTAIAYTFVPEKLKIFMKQQLRWKKSWIRESFIAGGFIWKKHPIMSISFYLSVILPILAPVVVFRAFIWYPYTTGKLPWFYLVGLALMAAIYGLYYYIFAKDKKWIYGVFFATFYTLVLIWQLPYAFLTIRDSRWGTR